VEAVDVVVPVTPERWHPCQPPWPGAAPPPQRPQVTALPPVTPVVPASPRHRWLGPVCGAATRAAGPLGGPTGGVGPRVPATTALCPGASHLAQRTTHAWLDALVGGEVGLGTLGPLEQATPPAVAEPVAEARASGQPQPAA
jgi:hypothetical protein